MRRRSLVLASAAAALSGASRAETSPLVLSSAGTLPLLLTVPHDGDETIASVPIRINGTTVRDLGTRPLAESVASILEQRVKERPRMVIAKFSRKFLDANRPEQEAMESSEALPAYRSYHGEIERHLAELKTAFPHGAVLVDIHGQSQEPNTTFRGTRGGLTVKALLQRSGAEAIQGEKSILGGLASKGYSVNPGIGASSLEEDRRFAGGHTVYAYGSHRPQGIDAIQLEFGRTQRASPNLAEHLAESLVLFLTHYQYLPK